MNLQRVSGRGCWKEGDGSCSAESSRRGWSFFLGDRWRQTRFPAQSFLHSSACNYVSLAARGNFTRCRFSESARPSET